MKPPAFDYVAPRTVPEAIAALASGDDAKVLAGGQSLIPALNFRLSAPALLVDINRIEGLDGVAVADDNLTIAALARHADLERPACDDPVCRLLARVSHYVGHLPIRVRGTFAGSLAHADPAAEWCAAALALDASIVAAGPSGDRVLAAADFFQGPFTTALGDGEIITSVRMPLLGHGGTGFAEKSRTAGDFAMVAVVATLSKVEGVIDGARIAVAGAEGTPLRAAEAERVLIGAEAGARPILEAADAAADGIEPIADTTCSVAYRRQLTRVLTRRALEEAAAEAA